MLSRQQLLFAVMKSGGKYMHSTEIKIAVNLKLAQSFLASAEQCKANYEKDPHNHVAKRIALKHVQHWIGKTEAKLMPNTDSEEAKSYLQRLARLRQWLQTQGMQQGQRPAGAAPKPVSSAPTTRKAAHIPSPAARTNEDSINHGNVHIGSIGTIGENAKVRVNNMPVTQEAFVSHTSINRTHARSPQKSATELSSSSHQPTALPASRKLATFRPELETSSLLPPFLEKSPSVDNSPTRSPSPDQETAGPEDETPSLAHHTSDMDLPPPPPLGPEAVLALNRSALNAHFDPAKVAETNPRPTHARNKTIVPDFLKPGYQDESEASAPPLSQQSSQTQNPHVRRERIKILVPPFFDPAYSADKQKASAPPLPPQNLQTQNTVLATSLLPPFARAAQQTAKTAAAAPSRPHGARGQGPHGHLEQATRPSPAPASPANQTYAHKIDIPEITVAPGQHVTIINNVVIYTTPQVGPSSGLLSAATHHLPTADRLRERVQSVRAQLEQNRDNPVAWKTTKNQIINEIRSAETNEDRSRLAAAYSDCIDLRINASRQFLSSFADTATRTEVNKLMQPQVDTAQAISSARSMKAK